MTKFTAPIRTEPVRRVCPLGDTFVGGEDGLRIEFMELDSVVLRRYVTDWVALTPAPFDGGRSA